MGLKELQWFVDAWAVHDGKLFASHRLDDTSANYLKSAESTVFMSVPDLQPVPVGRISTALRATRSGFQDRLRAANGAEIPFESLEQIRDLVRRGYLGGGLGPGASTALGEPGPTPVVDGGPGAAYVDEFVPDEPWSDGDGVIPTTAPRSLERAVTAVAVGALLQWEELLDENEPSAERRFWSFAHQVAWGGVLDEDHPGYALENLGEVARRFGADRVAEAVERLVYSNFVWRHAYDPAFNRAARGLLAVTPLPRSSRWDVRLNRLSEMQILPVVDRRFWIDPRTSVDIAPFVLVARLRGTPLVGQLRGENPPSVRAFDEARSSLNRTSLPEDAELALEGYFESCLNEAPTDHDPHSGGGSSSPVSVAGEERVEPDPEPHHVLRVDQPHVYEDEPGQQELGY